MCFIDDHKVRACSKELSSPAFALDVIQAYYRVRICRKDALAWWQVSLEARGASGSHSHGPKVKSSFELLHPLFDKMRWAQDNETLDIAAIQELSSYECRFDCLTDANVVSDEQAHGIEFERHEERHELIRSWFDRDLTEAAKWTCAASKRQHHRIS
jgi:hypothetical protein